jgi:hypothetical protein
MKVNMIQSELDFMKRHGATPIDTTPKYHSCWGDSFTTDAASVPPGFTQMLLGHLERVTEPTPFQRSIVVEATVRGWASRLPKEFKEGARCCRFWDPESDNETGCVITRQGVRVLVPHDKPFMSWTDIFGSDFASLIPPEARMPAPPEVTGAAPTPEPALGPSGICDPRSIIRDSRCDKGISGSKDTNPKDSVGIKKAPLSTVSMPVMFEVGVAMLEGARKYSRHNYRIAGIRASAYFDATLRHLASWWEGEDLDTDSGVNHITKAIAGLMVLRDSMLQGNWVDDRPPVSKGGWLKDLNERASIVVDKYPEPKPAYTELNCHTGQGVV